VVVGVGEFGERSGSETAMKIYTKGGDRGETSLIGGQRVSKDDLRLEAYGTIDELNSVIGLARASAASSRLDAELALVQSDLFDIGAQLAAEAADSRFPGASETRVEELERSIDSMEALLEPLKNFILPGGTELAARLHLARTVCRRGERLIVSLHRDDLGATVTYVNRLSDYLFVAARFANHEAGVEDVVWKRTKN
jgi:cob(I)alamin adenosyltransferase